MPDLTLVKEELSVYGIRILDGGRCEVALGGKRRTYTVPAEIEALKDAIQANKQFLRNLWKELGDLTVSGVDTATPGNDITQRLFSSALVRLYAMSGAHKQLAKERHFLRVLLKKDISKFSEAFMSKVTEYRVCVDWMDQMLKIDIYKLKLIKAAVSQNSVTAMGGPWTGGLELNMEERVYDASNKADDEDTIRDGRKLRTPYDKENLIPDTYNKPDEFEPGFYYRDMKQEPYAFDEEDDNPYPHRNLLWQ